MTLKMGNFTENTYVFYRSWYSLLGSRLQAPFKQVHVYITN